MTLDHDFFQAGGTLRLDDPSYIRRPADDELYAHLLAGRYCYVLTSRQRGKSSLMIRAADRLRRAGVAVSTVDLSAIGTQVTPDEWYYGILTRLVADMGLAVDVADWWRQRAAIGPVQRLAEFLRDCVLPQVAAPIVIFLDEIDTTLAIRFSDDFFAAIRQFYNLRASEPAYDRLTFALLGVATPTDLIKDPSRTPFNIGRAVTLGEFSRSDAAQMQQALDQRFPGCGARILDRIFFWSGGHPYLTQRLCQAAAELPAGALGDAQIDALVRRLFFGPAARAENNLRYVQSSVEALVPAERRALLQLYRRVLAGAPVAEDPRSPAQERLRLIGLLRAEQGRLEPRNQIYRSVFSDAWARGLLPLNWSLIVIAASAAVLLAALLLGGWLFLRQRAEQQRIAQIAALSQSCGLDAEQARRAFLQLDQPQRVQLFRRVADDQVWRAQLALARCVAPALPQLPDTPERRALVSAVCCAIRADDPYEAQRIGGGACGCDDSS